MRRAAWRISFVAAMLLVGVTACSASGPPTPVPSSAEVVGAWTHSDKDGNEATIVLAADGGLTLSGIPATCLAWAPSSDLLDRNDVVDTTGSWDISDGQANSFPEVTIYFESTRANQPDGTFIGVDGVGSEMQLFLMYGDADDGLKLYFAREGQTRG